MSIKDDVNYVKQELSSDEKMLEGLLKVEKVYHKHKLKFVALIAIILLAFGGNAIKNSMEEGRLTDANEALLALQQNPDDSAALETLKSKNPPLYELYIYSNAIKDKDKTKLKTLSASSNAMIADLSKYHLATLDHQVGYSKYYNELSKIEEAFVALQKGKDQTATDKLSFIEQNSPFYNLALLLKHQTIKVEQ
ncbi:MAG: hypothetical protein JXQ76_07185 [Campylobacterales bacterium]|nr:hypothetical protein [Campylobacterales bacterium]